LAKINFRRGGDALPGVVANRQVGPTFSEIAFGNHSRAFSKMSWPHLQLGCEIVRGARRSRRFNAARQYHVEAG